MNDLKRYYRQVASWLPCGGKTKREMMARIRATVDAYIAEHPTADLAAIQARFGTPQQIAAAFVDEMGTEELLNKLRIRRRIIKIIFLCVAIFLAIWAIAVLTLLITGLIDELGYSIVTPPVWMD